MKHLSLFAKSISDLTDSKFLITTGVEDGVNWEDKSTDDVWHTDHKPRSEIIDMSESGNYICHDWVDYPIAVHSMLREF